MNKKNALALLKDLKDEEKRRDWLAYLKQIPAAYDNDIKKWVHKAAYDNGRNIIAVPHKEDRQKAFCAKCKKRIILPDGIKHNENFSCPHCRADGHVVHAWRKSEVYRKGYFLYFQKTDYNTGNVVCRGIYYWLLFGPGDCTEKMALQDHSGILFTPQGVDHRSIFIDYFGCCYYRKYKSAFSRFSCYGSQNGWSGIPEIRAVCFPSLEQAIKGTFLQHCQPEVMRDLQGDIVKYLELFVKYPKIELLIKGGLENLIWEKLVEHKTMPVNWRGKSMSSFLRLPNLGRKQKQYLKGISRYISNEWLRIMQMYMEESPGHNIAALPNDRWILRDCAICHGIMERIEEIHSLGVPLMKIFTKAIAAREAKSKWPDDFHDFVITWSDYLRMAKRLKLNLADTAALMPKNIKRAHDNLMKQIKFQENQELNRRIEQAKEMRQYLHYENAEYFCRPALNAEELIAEGAALHHCVGTYADKYAAYKTHIVLIRRKSEPDTPFVTMEIGTDNHVVQVRAEHNRAPENGVKAFVEEFKQQVLSKAKKGRKAA